MIEGIKVFDWICDQEPNITQEELKTISEELRDYSEGLKSEADEEHYERLDRINNERWDSQ